VSQFLGQRPVQNIPVNAHVADALAAFLAGERALDMIFEASLMHGMAAGHDRNRTHCLLHIFLADGAEGGEYVGRAPVRVERTDRIACLAGIAMAIVLAAASAADPAAVTMEGGTSGRVVEEHALGAKV
jgi:hypothetical protein